jgi:hypothetical protein
MNDHSAGARAPCRETGTLVHKQFCYALRRDGGDDLWLEMDAIPVHLVDRMVQVEGRLYGDDLVSVERIGPA